MSNEPAPPPPVSPISTAAEAPELPLSREALSEAIAREDARQNRRFYLFVGAGALGVFGGVVTIALFVGQSSCDRVSNAVWGVSLAAGAAAVAVGILAGYLFGIPRAPNDGKPTNVYGVNTSLEQISDWVVKILVGLGLTELSRAPDGMVRLAKSFERAVVNVKLAECPGPCCSAQAKLAGIGQFGAGLVLYFAVYGFLLGYAHMRLFMAPAFSDADKLLNRKVRRAEEANQEAERAAEQAQKMKQHAQAASQERDEAVAQAGKARQQTQDYESTTKTMLDALYTSGGYERAIVAADDFVKAHGDPADAGFWLRYACAWGQKAKASLAKQDTSGYENAKETALLAVRRMIDIGGESARAWARKYWDTDDEDEFAENDLAVFKNEPEFAALLGPARTP